MPWSADFATDYGNDDPNTILQHALFGGRFQYGRDFDLILGPWAIWYQRHYWPTTYVLFVVTHAVVAIGLALTVIAAIRRAGVGGVAAWILVCAALGLMAIDLDARMFLAATLIPVLAGSGAAAGAIFLAMVVAMGSLAKASFLVAAAPMLFLVAVDDVGRRRALPWAAIAFAAAIPLLWVAASHDLAHFPRFVAEALAMAAGYGETMGHFGSGLGTAAPFRVSPAAIAYLLLCIAVAALLVLALGRERRGWLIGTLSAIGLVLFSAWKAGFVREDPTHVLHALVAVVLTILVVALWHWRSLAETNWGRWLAPRLRILGIALLVGGGVAIGATAFRYPDLVIHKPARLLANLENALLFATGRSDAIVARHRQALDRIRRDWPMPEVTGPVAIAGPMQTVGLAHGYDLVPLPTLNVYQAWTARLVERMSQFFSSPDRPPTVFVDLESVDGLAFWMTIHRHYHPVARVGRNGRLLQMRASAADAETVASPSTVRTRFDEAIELPRGDLVHVTAKIETTVLGRLVELFYKKAFVVLVVEFSDGTRGEFRFGPEIARSGRIFPPSAIFGDPSLRALRATFRAGPQGHWFYSSEIDVAIMVRHPQVGG
ncbi:MAG: hypothetical protein FJX47_01765 [Alphaproteobacteria bacterium]|nr:hypothetical protein [Alphaproteobacteria bacterium]